MIKTKNIVYILTILILAQLLVPKAYAATPQELITKYNNALKTGDKVNVLIVPGHDDDYWGTEFGDVREADVVVAIGQYLYTYLKNDPRLNVTISRTQMGYTDTFKNYFVNNRQAILDFISTSKAEQQALIASGTVQQTVSVPHNTANPEVALRLFGINKWANENNIDITIHLHVNDQGGRQYGKVGEYTGLTVYIPERQFDNARTSAAFGQALYTELMLKNHKSTYPAESAGLVEDQDLIAIGASNSAKSAAALIEYGYIYEPQYKNLNDQEIVTKDLAYQTFLGIHRFFGDRATFAAQVPAPQHLTFSSIFSTSYLPHTWSKNLAKNASGNDVSSLQAALTKAGIYSCGVTGTYGPCTEKGVRAFQKKYGIQQTGTVGPSTRAKLNTLFSS